MTLAIQSPIGHHDSITYVAASLVRALTDLGHRPALFPTAGTPFDALQPAHLSAIGRGRKLRLNGPRRVDRLLVWHGYEQPARIATRSREALLYWDSDCLSDQAALILRLYDRVWGVTTYVAARERRAEDLAHVHARGRILCGIAAHRAPSQRKEGPGAKPQAASDKAGNGGAENR